MISVGQKQDFAPFARNPAEGWELFGGPRRPSSLVTADPGLLLLPFGVSCLSLVGQSE